MNSIVESLLTRRSVRAYKSEQISEEELNAVMEAGRWAPTAMNLQTPIMVAVQDKETIAYMSRLNAQIMGKEGDPFYGAPTVIVVLADRSKPCCVQDGSLVMGNLMNAAHALGLGSCWVNRAKELFDMPEGKALLKKWGIEGDYVGVGNCILGYSDGPAPEPKPRKEKYIYRV